jgi:hypothetical protein
MAGGNSHDRRMHRRSMLDLLKIHKVELGIEFCLGVFIALYQLGAEQMDIPHNFWVGLGSWVIAGAIGVRIIWILMDSRRLVWKIVLCFIPLMIFGWLVWSNAYPKYQELFTLSEAAKKLPIVPKSWIPKPPAIAFEVVRKPVAVGQQPHASKRKELSAPSSESSEVKTEESKPEPKDAPPSGPIGVYNAPGGKFTATCSVFNGPNGKAIENHGEMTLNRSSVNAPQPCSPSQLKADAIDFLLETGTGTDNPFGEHAWIHSCTEILHDEFGEQTVKDFMVQPDIEKKKEFLIKLKASLHD